MAGGRVDDHAGRLVDDEQVLVLVDDRDGDRLRLQRRVGWGGQDHPEPLASGQAVTRASWATVDERAAIPEQALGVSP
jgi:hypothetical protein